MYYVIYFLLLILSISEDKMSEKVHKNVFWVSIGIITILSIFRYGVGADYFSYSYIYRNINSNPYKELVNGTDRLEILFRLFSSFIKIFTENYQIYIALISVGIIILMSKSIYNNSKKYITTLFLYYSMFIFVWIFSGLRQAIALALSTYILLEYRGMLKFIQVVIITTILCGFHMSAIIFPILYYTPSLNLSRKKIFVITAVSLAVTIFPVDMVIVYLSEYIEFFDRALPYIDLGSSIFTLSFIIRFIIMVGCIFFYNEVKINSENSFIIDYLLIGLNIYFIFSFSELSAARLSIYGYIFIIFIIPEVLFIISKNFNTYIIIVLIIIGSFSYFNKELLAMKYQSGMITDEIYVPFTNIFNKESYDFETIYK